MENTIVSKYVKEDTAEVLKTLGELAKQNELWVAIREVVIEYMKTEQAYGWLMRELAKMDEEIIEKSLSIYPELLSMAENALRVHSPWRPLGVMERAEKARILALQEVNRFIEEYERLQREKMIRFMEIQEKKLVGLMQLLKKLVELASASGKLAEPKLVALPAGDGSKRLS